MKTEAVLLASVLGVGGIGSGFVACQYQETRDTIVELRIQLKQAGINLEHMEQQVASIRAELERKR